MSGSHIGYGSSPTADATVAADSPGAVGYLLRFVRIRFVLGTAPRHASIPPNQNGTMAKGR